MTAENAACIKNILLSLRSEPPALAANESSLALFDEFVREEEFGLAANVCWFTVKWKAGVLC